MTALVVLVLMIKILQSILNTNTKKGNLAYIYLKFMISTILENSRKRLYQVYDAKGHPHSLIIAIIIEHHCSIISYI